MHARTAIAAVLACSLLLPACNRQQPPQSAPPAASPATGPQTALGKRVEQAMAEARRKLETENISLNDKDGGWHVGKHASGSHDPNLPKAEITPAGDFLIDGKAVAVNDAQRALLLQYRRDMMKLVETGMALGARGADMGMIAVKEVFSGLFSGNPDQIEQRMEAEGRKIEAEALRICDDLVPMLATQQQLAAALPEFKPYASMTQEDIDDCRKDGRGAARSVASGQQAQIREDIRSGIREAVQGAAAATAAATAAVAGGAGGNNTVTVNGVRFLLPPGDISVDSVNDSTTLRHGNGLRVKLDASSLQVNGEGYPRPASGSEVDLRTGGTVKIDGVTIAARP